MDLFDQMQEDGKASNKLSQVFHLNVDASMAEAESCQGDADVSCCSFEMKKYFFEMENPRIISLFNANASLCSRFT